jgi:trehalose 6-phosphate phosphatase
MPRNILTPRNLHTLASFAASNVLLAFDYDGTLAPIAATPSSARMRAETRRRLARIAERYPCVVISGRTLEDLERRLNGIPVWYLFGNHGFEPHSGSDAHAAQVNDWVDLLSARLPAHPGLVIEHKKYSVTVHYRHARNKKRVVETIRDAVRELTDVRTVGGAKAVNLLPRGGADKGVAVQRARRMFACDTVIYVGDDDTDEDAFVSAPPERLMSIRVGARGPTKAQYRLHSQRDVDRLLQQLLHFRTAR